MALFDLASKNAGQPLYQFLGGERKTLETDLTIGLGSISEMRSQARDFIDRGVRIIKIKLGKKASEDVERVRAIREEVGDAIVLRVDANQGWSFEESILALRGMHQYNIQFCEQPMRYMGRSKTSRIKKPLSHPNHGR